MQYAVRLPALILAAGALLAQAPPTAALMIQGDVSTPLSLTAPELAKLPRQTVSVPASDGSIIVYEGVSLFDILQKAGVPSGSKLRGKALTTYVVAMAKDGYQVAFTLGEIDPQFGDETIVVADTRDGKPLPDQQGPFRLVCPNDKEGARSVRMLETLRVVRPAQ